MMENMSNRVELCRPKILSPEERVFLFFPITGKTADTNFVSAVFLRPGYSC